MQADPLRIVNISARQYDHGGTDTGLRAAAVQAALDWIKDLHDVP
jgi:hypothetical protein